MQLDLPDHLVHVLGPPEQRRHDDEGSDVVGETLREIEFWQGPWREKVSQSPLQEGHRRDGHRSSADRRCDERGEKRDPFAREIPCLEKQRQEGQDS